MPKRLLIWGAALAAVLIAVAAVLVLRAQTPDPSQVHIFKGVRGPQAKSVVVAAPLATIAQYDRGSDHRLAILVTDPNSGWLGLVRGFKAHGVPITVTQDPAKALRHKVVLVYPIVSGRVLTGPQIRALGEHVRGGGTVLAFNLAGGGLEELFGARAGAELQTRQRVRWTTASGVAEEDEIVVSSRGETRIGSIGYAPTTARVLAAFDDGSTAVACRTVVGEACVLGVDLGAFAQRAMNGRAEVISRSYANGYEPSLDVIFRWIRDLYVAGEPQPWLVSTAPAGKDVSILLTHDVDFTRSVVNSDVYAKAMKTRGVNGTFFVQTKYIRDYNDEIFFDDQGVAAVRKLVAQGMDVGSHTVAHADGFESMSLGSGKERYPRYRPFVETVKTVKGGTILGELRVSKFLLDDLTGAKVVSFRPGRLSYPFDLPQALVATGYKHSSSISANIVLTHLPFQLTDSRGNAALEPIFEYPVTIEDEAAPRLGDRFDAANTVIDKIARHQGVATVLIHPNITDHKLAFEERLMDRWAGRAWMGSLAEFGSWWTARDALETDVVVEDGRMVLRAAAPQGARNVAVRFPKSGREVTLNLPAAGRTAVAVN